MKHIKKISHYNIIDINFDSDAMEVELIVDEELVKRGDWYHDKIDDFIAGFVKAVEYFEITYSYSESQVADFDDC